MRSFLLSWVLLAVLPLGAQEVGYWQLDVHANSGTLGGHYVGTEGGQAYAVDLQNDLGLASAGLKVGLGYGLEYQGHGFALELSTDALNFTGSKKITENVTVNGQTYSAGGVVTSSVKTTTSELVWTLREGTSHPGWFGFDACIRDVGVSLTAQGSVSGVTQSASYSGSLPLPMVGLSAGFQLDDGTVVARAYFHTMYFFGASYNVYGADLRYFPVLWGGFRAYTTVAQLKVPNGSIWSNLDIALNQNTYGVGGVLRF